MLPLLLFIIVQLIDQLSSYATFEANNGHRHPVVRTDRGAVRGIVEPGREGVPYEAFYGIPFAQPPIGNLRFANPRETFAWSGTLNATVPKPMCIQKNNLLPGATVEGDEDCLYLNVYRPLRPKSAAAELLPVIVYIHGGAFFAGCAGPDCVGPQYFMNTGQVLVVTIAYRLGVLGFMSTGDELCPGNFGLKDQAMALRWVQRNARRFGGDAGSVTVMGVSAGAASAHLLMMSPLAKGLFHRAISSSGNALGPYNDPTPDPLALAQRHAELLGIPYTNPASLVHRMRRRTARDLVESTDRLKFWSIDPLTLYRLVVEKPNSIGAFLTDTPKNISRRGNYEQLPWLQGTVQNEGAIRAALILANRSLVTDLNARLDDLLPQLMELRETETNSYALINEKINQRYLNGLSEINESNEQGFVNLYSDRSFLYPEYKSIYDFVRTARDLERTPVYVYKFLFKGPISYSKILTNTEKDYGVIHLDDTIYLFQTNFLPPFDPDSDIGKVTRTMVQYYVDFAVEGKPTDLGLVKPCNRSMIADGTFCEYYAFINGYRNSNELNVIVDNYFDETIVDFWDDILND